MSAELLVTPAKEGLDAIVQVSHVEELSPAEAYAQFSDWCDQEGFRPDFYVSTAITTGGHVLDPRLDPHTQEGMRTVIERNNALASRLMGQLAVDSQLVHADNVLMATELGNVKGWEDSDYMQFWAFNITGVDTEDTEEISARFLDKDWEHELAVMNDRSLPRNVRWPEYERFTQALIGEIQNYTQEWTEFINLGSMIQLVDTERSMGCSAEKLIARAFDLELLAPQVDRTLLPENDALRQELSDLALWGAKVGLKPVVARLAIAEY